VKSNHTSIKIKNQTSTSYKTVNTGPCVHWCVCLPPSFLRYKNRPKLYARTVLCILTWIICITV